MKIGIGLPNAIPRTRGTDLVEWARRAEAAGFSSLGTIDRIAYPSFESMVSLAAAAAVTDRIGLVTDILLAPTRNPVLLAKEAAGIDEVSGGRFTLGMAVGGREDDYRATELPFSERGKSFDSALEVMHRVWRGELVNGAQSPIGPSPSNGDSVRVLIGGASDRALKRAVEWGAGWTAGGSPPDVTAEFGERVRSAWADSDRDGTPYLMALSYFGVADEATAGAYIKDYYAFLGPFADQIAAGVRRTPEDLKQTTAAFDDAGMDELILFPTISSPDQVDLLAEAVL